MPFAYFFLGAFLLQGFELPVLVFVDEYPASLDVRHCLVKQKNKNSSLCTDAQNKDTCCVSSGTRGRNPGISRSVEQCRSANVTQKHHLVFFDFLRHRGNTQQFAAKGTREEHE